MIWIALTILAVAVVLTGSWWIASGLKTQHRAADLTAACLPCGACSSRWTEFDRDQQGTMMRIDLCPTHTSPTGQTTVFVAWAGGYPMEILP